MSRKTPIEQAKLIENEYRQYVKSTFTLNDETFYDKFQKEMDEVLLAKGPYLNKILPFKRGKSIQELIDIGKLNKDFNKLGTFNPNMKLYSHQEEGLEKVSNGRSVVVTTGTGSGKTETFLIPILNHILNDHDIDKPGVRAIFLFPMNALVNDQMNRIRRILKSYPKIKFGRYVGDTKEDVNPEKERKVLHDMFDEEIPSNELISREEIRQNPPHLLFTNYSMLEYLLLRPKDTSLLEEKYTNKWQFIVLDEAHTYAGALGIEVGMLLRRLTEKINRKPQFILTSATLGDQNKDENDIVNFAKNLTGATFETDDIIFSKRVKLQSNGKYRLSGEDYSYLKNKLSKYQNDPTLVIEQEILSCISKYIPIDGLTLNEAIKTCLKFDNNVLLIDQIIQQPMSFYDVYRYFKIYNLTEHQFSDLVYLISYVFSDSKEIFDLKYHTFVRTIDGCYVTLDEEKNLSLSKCLYINDSKAFEIGKCKKCDTTYIIGTIVGNDLHQNTDIDIYENSSEIGTTVDYFIFDKDISYYDKDYLVGYNLCVKCGKIHEENEINPETCSCDEKYLKKVYRVKKDKNDDKTDMNAIYSNNISYCPCCRKSANNGIVSAFYLGKDSTTAVLTQLLLKAIDDTKEKKEKVEVELSEDSVFGTPTEKKEEEKPIEYTKQLIEFSDSRQQASFTAIFCEYNHERFMRKKLLFDVINDSDIPYSVSKVRTILENRIENYDLFANKYNSSGDGSHKNAWITILKELLSIDGSYTAEGLGLYAFKVNLSGLSKFESFIPGAFKKQGFPNYNLTFDELCNILSIIANTFRNHSAIEYQDSNLSIEERKEEFSYRMFNCYVTLQKAAKATYPKHILKESVHSLLPVNNSQSNKLIDYVMECTGFSFDTSKAFIGKCYELLSNNHIIFEDETCNELYKIKAEQFDLYGNKQLNWYYCDKCKSVTIYNCKDVCPTCASKSLKRCDPEIVFADNYYRKEYKTKKVERLVFKEHTGQLTPSEGLKIQKAFIKKLVNVLSCSTTFEMGVDIGSLETVFMRNVPPTPANYVQRAGRAGRGKDSSAFILTFCGNSSHDYNYFKTPEKMVDGRITPPYFKLDNEKIVLRHIMDTALSFYLKLNPTDFTNIGTFISDFQMFKNYINSKPTDLGKYIDTFITDTKLHQYMNFGWIDKAIGKDGLLTEFFDEFVNEIDSLTQSSNDELSKGNHQLANYYLGEIEKKKNKPFIDALANSNIIPKYGFPIDNVNLKVQTEKNKVDLDRDLQIALSEYAPDCEVMANGKKYTSRYIIIPRKKGITKYYSVECEKCGKTNYNIDKNHLIKCDNCDETLPETNEFFVCPDKGFKADFKTVTSKTIKPKKVYANEIEYIGKGSTEKKLDYFGKIEIISNKDDELLVRNNNPFYMCEKCGYTIIDKTLDLSKKLDIENKGHSNGYDECESNTLQKISLGYSFKTDVIKFKFKKHYSIEESYSFLYAFLDGISTTFCIERNDINGVLSQEKDATYSIIIYDDVPGGAGHVKQLLDVNAIKKTFNETLIKISSCVCDEQTSCYNCLRNYKNQRRHKHLKRKAAIKVLKDILKK